MTKPQRREVLRYILKTIQFQRKCLYKPIKQPINLYNNKERNGEIITIYHKQ